MKYLFLMGGSGCGKTTLAMNLEKFDPDNYKRTLEVSTREIREGETNQWDYDFITEEKFWELVNEDQFFEKVELQFAPNRYGAEKRHLDPEKWNVIVACLEGFLSATRNIHTDTIFGPDEAVLVNILNDCELDIIRDGRNPKQEENVNLSVIRNLLKTDDVIYVNGVFVRYVELKLSELKEFRESDKKTLKKFKEILKNKYE